MTDDGHTYKEGDYPATPGTGNVQDTFVMLKPDALERGVVNEVLAYFQQHNEETQAYADSPLRIRAMTKIRMDHDLIEEHYDNVDPDVLEELHEYFGTQDGDGYEVVPMIVYGEDAVERVRDIVVDPTDPDEATFLPENSEPGTIRGDIVTEGTPVYADPKEWPHYRKNQAAKADVPVHNLLHAAEGLEDAKAEIDRFFGQFVSEDTSQDTVKTFFGEPLEDEPADTEQS